MRNRCDVASGVPQGQGRAGGSRKALPVLRPYQVEAMRAILDSVRNRRGLTFTVMMSRQAGKNELSAQLEAGLLLSAMREGGNLVKGSPTFEPQGVTSMNRLTDRLQQIGVGKLVQREHGNTIKVGSARAIFLSAAEGANVVGATAHLLLEIDEAQDVSVEKFDKDFRPMGAPTNCTTVLYGTPWDSESLLETARERNRELERVDGIKRNFEADWTVVARHNPAYAAYVEGERQRLGEDHPLFRTQYGLQLVRSGGGFLSGVQRAQLQGEHERLHRPLPGETYVAGLDLAGESDEPDASGRRQDSTALTIARVMEGPPPLARAGYPLGGAPAAREGEFRKPARPPGEAAAVAAALPIRGRPLPVVEVVEQVMWRGEPHGALAATLVDLLRRVWRVRRLVVDATGLGHTLAGLLVEALGSGTVERFVFGAGTKSQLGFDFLAAVNAGGVRLYRPDGSPECAELWRQVELAERHVYPGQRLDFFVPPAKGHDDLLMSLALAVRAGQGTRERRARGTGRDSPAP